MGRRGSGRTAERDRIDDTQERGKHGALAGVRGIVFDGHEKAHQVLASAQRYKSADALDVDRALFHVHTEMSELVRRAAQRSSGAVYVPSRYREG